jgi:hypothetical protein
VSPLTLGGDLRTGLIIDRLRREPVLLQLPQVYTLIAPSTSSGAASLDAMKRRLPGKNYGTAVGDLRSFWEMIRLDDLPPGVDSALVLEATQDVFYRCQVGDESMNTKAVRGGSHQTLVLGGVARELMREIEAAFEGDEERALFCGHSFSAPLITSCNVSGDPLGSITDEDRAMEFIRQRGVGLWVRCPEEVSESGSFPILDLGADGIRIGREGPGLDRILRSMPPGAVSDRAAG